MRITGVSLTNFRSFGETQTIDIAPVTLLFGPNSVGKSTVLMSLAYIQEILENGHCDPKRLFSLGDKPVGGFRSLVFSQDLERPIKIRIDYEAGQTVFGDYASAVEELASHLGLSFLLMPDIGGSINNGAIEVEVAWSKQFARAYVRHYRTWINGKFVAQVSSSEDLKNTRVSELNTDHPILQPEANEEWLEEQGYSHTIMQGEYLTAFEEIIDGLNPNSMPLGLSKIPEGITTHSKRLGDIALTCRYGAIPLLGRHVDVRLAGKDIDDMENHLDYLVVRDTLSQILVEPLDRLLGLLKETVFIGPLRVIPGSDYTPNPYPDQSDWVDGAAAWDLLSRNPNRNKDAQALIKRTSEWLSQSDKLDAGYEIVNKSISEYAGLGSHPDSLGFLEQRHVYFKDLKTGINLSASQLGTGISQVLPIVVAACSEKPGLVSVEQPELHIHPRLQVEIADVLLREREKHSFLIETHSEHIILRLLKRIRQKSDNELPEGYPSVGQEDISIVYLEPTENGALARRIRVDEDGEFVDRWPEGFFVERREELL